MSQVYTDAENQSGAVCRQWIIDLYTAKAMNMIISVSINVINTIIKFIMIKLITMVGEDTRSA